MEIEVTYKKNFNQSYMIIEPEYKTEEIYELTMLSNNRIAGLLPVEMTLTDGATKYWYDITGKQSFSDYLERKGAGNEILRVLFGCMEEIFRDLETYLLEEQRILLKAKHIYLDFEGRKVYVAYLPGKRGNLVSEFQEFMEQLLQKLDHGDKEAVAIGYEIYQLSLDTELAFPDMLKAALQKGKEAKGNEQRDREILDNAYGSETIPFTPDEEGEHDKTITITNKEEKQKGKGFRFHFPKWNLHIFQKKEKEAAIAYVPFVTVEEEPEEHPTEYLGDYGKEAGKLVYQGHGGHGDFYLDKEVFLIGKNAKEVDGCIKQKSISRIHAKIEKDDDYYYIEDLNSTNGTFVNGQQLEYRQKMKLEPRDHIVFGTMVFMFL